jgi:hypothetical protein
MQTIRSLSSTHSKEEYIIYTLYENEEYVVGVNPWITYSSAEMALNKIIDTTACRRYVYPMGRMEIRNRTFAIGEHIAVLTHDNGLHGYIARVA